MGSRILPVLQLEKAATVLVVVSDLYLLVRLLDITVALDSLLLQSWNLVVVQACIFYLEIAPLSTSLWLSKILLQLLLSKYHISLILFALRHYFVEYPIFFKTSIVIFDG